MPVFWRATDGVQSQLLIALSTSSICCLLAGWRLHGAIKRRADVNTTALIGTVSTENSWTEGGLTTAPVVSASTLEGYLVLKVTGVNANTVVWNAAMSYSEVRE